MIERTKARIEEDKKITFIDTKGYQDAKEKLHKNRVVVIKGNTGDGKTTTAIRLIHGLIEEQQGRQPLQLHNIEDLDSLPPKSQLITFIDNIFGEKVAREKDVGEWNKRIKSVLPTLCVDKPTEANFLLITIRNEVFNSLRSHSVENVFVDSNIIDLSSDDYKIEEEMLELLELYKPKKGEFAWKEHEKKEIVRYATGIGFPQCCRLFRDIPDLQKERVNFFKMPFDFLSTALEKLKECNALLFLFLNGWGILVKDLDPSGEKVNKTLLKEAFDIDLKDVGDKKSAWSVQEKIQFVRESLDSLSGFLVVKEKWSVDCFVYRFAHDSIHATVALLYGQITPIGYIKCCPSESLSLLTISKSSPDRIMISPDNYVYMFERIHREFESCAPWNYDYYLFHDNRSVSCLDVWTDSQFMERFVRWLNDKKIDKVDVLNKACRSRAKPCALYLLSQGVKPDKDTDWLSLITKGVYDEDIDVLKEVIYMNDEMKLDLLNEACEHGFVECVLYLLSQGVKPDKDTDWVSLIMRDLDRDDVDMGLLKKVFVYMNDEMKLDLLKEVCKHCLYECALYLLSQGVKPDKDTQLLSLDIQFEEWHDVDTGFLKKVFVYMNDEMKLDLLNKVCSDGLDWCALYLLSHGFKPDKDTDWFKLISSNYGVTPSLKLRVIDILKDVLIHMNDEMKLDLLNKTCEHGFVECVLYLLSQGVKPDKDMYCFAFKRYNDEGIDILKDVLIHMNDEMKLNLLNEACCSGLDECVKYLLSEDVECEENTPFCVMKTGNINMLRSIVSIINDEIKLVLLNVTSYTGLEEWAVYLLSEGGKPDNDTPFCVVRGGSVNVLCTLLQYDVIPTARAGWSKSSHFGHNISVLHEACLCEREEMVTMLCNTYPELVHDTSEWRQSPLLLAAETGNCGIFHTVEGVILKSLYRVEDEQHQCESVDGRVVHRNCVCSQYMSQLVDRDTILNRICEMGHTKLCVYMCQSYPELTTAVDKDGSHFLHYMAKFISDVSMFTECETHVKQYLESTGRMYDVTTILDNKGRTVLHMSCETGREEICKYLCQSCPELTTAVDKDGKTVLHVSCEREHTQICKYLCQSFPVLTKAVDKYGKTVLHVSCERGHREICKYLCQSFPELTRAVDKDGWHCLHYIAKNTFDVDTFTECEVYVKQYLEFLGLKYDIKTILNNRGQSVLDMVKYPRKNTNRLYDHLLQLFGK